MLQGTSDEQTTVGQEQSYDPEEQEVVQDLEHVVPVIDLTGDHENDTAPSAAKGAMG